MTKTETKSIKKKKLKFFNLKILNSFLLVLIILCGVSYIASINDLIIKGFRLQELKKEVNTALEETKEKDFKILSLESYNNLNKRAENMDMVAIGEVDYITMSGGVAMK